tara:strand:+ start:12875 stop:13078 length:204 start_codon:yes stop_codon:yes gene_type:complete
MTKRTVKMIDPPSGWKYGFPKEFTWDESKETFYEWMEKEGYPVKENKTILDMACRQWTEEVDDEETP